ncbi:hypothetical protein CVV67_17315 [Arthrobacter stackebrandtii]|nr:hypothetical protein CVV67_17315 [Arthrobacter stackebrandtii]
MSRAEAISLRMHRHNLWSPLPASAGGVVERHVAMQAQDYAYALWGMARRRLPTAEGNRAADLASAVDRGEILRTHVLRPTWHFVSPADARWLLELTAPHVHRTNKLYYGKSGLDGQTLSAAHGVLAAELANGRHRTRRQLQDALVRSGIEASGIRLSYILMHAELERLVISGASQGRQRGYALFDERVPGHVPGAPADRDGALKALAERYLGTRGPVGVKDFAVWSGLPMADARAGVVSAVEASPRRFEPCVVDGMSLWWEPSGVIPAPAAPRVDLLQCYDEYVMSYFESKPLIFMQAGPGPAPAAAFYHPVLIDGVIAGTWKYAPSPGAARVLVAPLRHLATAERLAVEAAAADFSAFHGLPGALEWV